MVEIERRDGLIRYALAPGEPGIDLDEYWRKRDPSWHFVMARLSGVHPDDVDRVIDEAVDDLLDSNIPLSQDTRQFIKADRQQARNRKAGSATETAPLHSSLAVSWIGSRNCWRLDQEELSFRTT